MSIASSVSRRSFACTMAVAILMAVAPGQANGFDMVAIATEIMMEDQGADNVLLAHIFGVDTSSPLRFTSFVDPAGMYFSFELVPNSTYLGQSITMSASGTFDPTTSTWTTSSTGEIGDPNTYGTTSTKTVTKNPDGTYTITEDVNHTLLGDFGNTKDGDLHTSVTASVPNGGDILSTEEGNLTDKNGNFVLGSDFEGIDSKHKGVWFWTVFPAPIVEVAGLNFAVVSNGTSSDEGGAGSFVTQIQSVPEPSTLTLGVIACVAAGLGCCCRRCKKGTARDSERGTGSPQSRNVA